MWDPSEQRALRLHVEMDGRRELTYNCGSISEMLEIRSFIASCCPTASFVIEPTIH
ncbi:MAG: hypothetical protein AAGF76_01150 [Pseudomonadota bacterium]